MNRSPVVIAFLVVIAVTSVIAPGSSKAQGDTTERPFVRGGVYDKPMLGRLAGRIAIGGYAELHARHERVDGARDEAGFVPKRFNLFVNSRVSDVVRFGAELEFEDGAEEIVLEFAAIDLRLHRAATLRAGMILTPLGRFNLSHDSPLNEFTDRPLVATDLVGSAFSEAGVGAFGEFSAGGSGRLTYEVYATNGLHDGLLLNSPDGTRLPLGRKNFEDANGSPALTGRFAWSPSETGEFGLSAYHGAYNAFIVEGTQVEPRRDVALAAVDAEWEIAGVRLSGEATTVRVELPPSLNGLFASRQRGAYIEAVRDIRRGVQAGLPNSVIAAKLRVDAVDFDTQLRGDAITQVSVGINYRPTPDTVLKFDFVRGRAWDRFNNASEFAKLLASVATYF
ncbi:MAG TPA: hypothetical protein VJR92_14640 [Gemmatimonadaceae bacterium]|nr:hypothetical protein [Gemmatimonadaceae bacterium]